ncbi:MAG TPA: wax ester/triacylglycerol synthase family O-acyltransferase, partial [Rubrivivax sp.]|nr:wax ester/triacylglycerol synthase family O-acyltransferase [Rubrivivax sp.]
MQHLSAIDAAFLHLETAEMPMHVGSLHRCRLPDGYDGNWHDDVKAHMAKRLHLAPVFTRKLALMP